MKKNKLFKKRLLLGMLMVSSISFPIILSSCSSASTAIDKLVSKGDGLKLSEQTSLSDFAKSALLSDAGMKKYADQIVGQTLFNLMSKLGSNDSPSKRKALYKQKFDENEKTIKESFESTQESSKSTNGSDFPIKFQQEELDPHGGSEESWKKEKELEWATTEFKNIAFENLYVSLVDGSGNHVLVTQENLNKVFNGGNEVKIAFTPNYNLDSSKPNFDSFVVSEIAKFQEFVFDQWVKSENPFIVNFATWNYGSITGNSNNYKTTATGHANNFTNPFQSTYSFPYFDDTKSNESESVVQKFIKFTNLTTTDVPNNSAGLKMNLSKFSTSTESYKLVSGRNEHSISDPSEAIASLHMFNSLVGSQANGATISTGTTNNLKKPLTTTANNGLDVITSNFVVDNPSQLQANGGTTGSGKTGNSIPYIEIAPDLVDRIFINPPKNNSGTPNGTKTLYAIDAFIPSISNTNQQTASPLSDYIFFRNKSGVTALSIDGGKYIGKATTYDEAKQKAGEIILYRYLESSLSGSNKDNTYAVDVRAKLNQFLTENFDTLIFQYWKNNSSNQIIDFSWLSDEQENVMDALTKYFYIYARRNDISSYQNALLNEKTAFSTNYGDKFAEKNGLASPYPYDFVNAKQSNTTTPLTQSKNTSSVNYGHYSLIDSIAVSKNPFDSSSNSNTTSAPNYWTDPYANNGVYSEYVSAVEKLVANVKPLESKSSTFKYSQYIFVDDFFINQALITYGADAEILGNNEKVKIAEKYISDNNSIGINNFEGKEFNVNNYQVSQFMINSIDSKDDINSALSNYMFGSTFDSSTNKWLFLEEHFMGNFQKPTSNGGSGGGAPQVASSSLPTITYSELDKYRLNYWLRDKSAISSVNLNEYLTFLKTIIAIDYLLKDNGSRFMNELINKTPSDKPSYLVWEVGYDSSVNANVNISTQKDLLYGTNGDSAFSNVNNAQGNAYYPNKDFENTYVENNNIDSIFITTGNYYKHVSQMTGFQNIVSSDNSSAISKPLAKMIFDDPTYNGNKLGLLYSYASSRDEFINLINGYSFSNQLNDLAKTMEKLFPDLVPQLKEVQNAEETSKKKELLVAIVSSTNENSSEENGQGTNNYKIPDDAFKPRNGYIKTSTANDNNGLYQDEIDKHSQIKYGSYLIQLNQGNLKDLSTFITYLSSSFASNMPGNGMASNQQTNIANQLTYNLIANLLVSVATSTSIQDEAFNKIAENYKIDIYDWRLNLQLGETWAKNYKDQDN